MAGMTNTNLHPPNFKITKQDSAVNFNISFLKILAMGNKRLFTDILWITTLLESDHSHYKNKDLNSWMFLRFKSIIELDPQFLKAYQFGGQYLSIIKDDLFGAEIIFDSGLEVFPEDYLLNFNSGFLQAFELGNSAKAIKNYGSILSHPKTPIYVKSIINKLRYNESNDLDLAYKLVLETYLNTDEIFLKEKLKTDLYAIKATIDLNCLNSLNSNSCNLKDHNGTLYIKRGNKYIAPNKFELYRLFRK